MVFSVHALAGDPGDTVYYEPGFRTVIETHLTLLRNHPATQRSAISPDKLHQYEGDFYGLLGELGVGMELHWIYLRVNGMESPNQFGRQLRDPYIKEQRFQLRRPPTEMISDLRTLYLTTRR
jgi:hypothetical protein